VEEMPIDETLAMAKTCETTAAAANSTVSIARMFLATKLVEARRYSKGVTEEAQAKLKEFQAQLDAQIKKLTTLKASTAERKGKALSRETERIVEIAEAAAKRVGEAAAVLADDDKLQAMGSADIRAAAEATTKAEIDANKALGEARKFITARQIETKSRESPAEASAELVKYQTRLSAAQSDVGKHKRQAATIESRLAVKKIVEEAEKRIGAAEAKIDAVRDLSKETDENASIIEGGEKEGQKDSEEAPAKNAKALDSAISTAAVTIKSAQMYC
jgi:hypothetical protein